METERSMSLPLYEIPIVNYVCHAEEYYKIYPFDWIKRTLKFDKIEGESALKSKQGQKTFVSTGNSPREEYGPVAI